MTRSQSKADAKEGPEPAASPCSCFRLRRTARTLTQVYDDALRPCGLRVTQYSLLAHALAEDGLSVTDLAERMAMDRTTLTRNLRPLEKRGLITVRAGRDRRSRAVCVTAQGKQLYREARPLWREAERAFRRQIGRRDATMLLRLLDRVERRLPT